MSLNPELIRLAGPVVDLLSRRGGLAPKNPALAPLDAARDMTRWLGGIYEPQIIALRRNAMLIANASRVELRVDPQNRKLTYAHSKPTQKVRSADVIHTMMEVLVAQILGPGWTVECGRMSSDGTSKPKRTRTSTATKLKSRSKTRRSHRK